MFVLAMVAAPVELSKSTPPAPTNVLTGVPPSVRVPPSVTVWAPASFSVLIVCGAVVVTLAAFE